MNNRPSTVAKSRLHTKKVFLSICWDWKDIICYELLLQDKIINFRIYCNQFDKLEIVIVEKWPELANRRGHGDNAKPHIPLPVKKAVTVWLGHSIASSMLPRSCFIRLLFVPVIKKFFSWLMASIGKRKKNAPQGIFCK